MQTRKMTFLHPDEVVAEIKRVPLVYLPIGLLEWHANHLPLGTDALIAEKTAELAAEQTGGLIWPTLYCGTERERPPQMLRDLGFEDTDQYIVGMDFPANILPSGYAAEETLAIMLRDQLNMMIRMGFCMVVIITGHAATNHTDVLTRLAMEFSATRPVRVTVVLPYVPEEDGRLLVGHASRIETAAMLAVAPECVRMDHLPPISEPLKNVDWAIVDYATFMGEPMPDYTVRPDDDPRLATAEDGWDTLHRGAAAIAAAAIAAYLDKQV